VGDDRVDDRAPLVLGVPMASVRSIAAALGRGDLAGVNRAVSTCLAITLAMAVLALGAGLAQGLVFEGSYLQGKLGAGMTPAELESARAAFLLSVFQVAAAFATRLPYGILEAHGDFVVRNGLMAGELGLRWVLTVGLLSWRPTLEVLAAIQVATLAAEFLASWACVARRHRGVRLGLSSFDRALVGGILSFSVYAMVLNVGTLLAFRCDALVIGAWMDAEATTQFDMGNKFFEPMTGLVIGIGAVVMPAATRLAAGGSAHELAPMLLKWSKVALSLVLPVAAFLLVLGPEFLSLWVGPEFAQPSGRVLRILMLSFLVYLPVRGVALPILMGLGSPARPAIALLVMGLVNVAISVALVGPLGLAGVALGTALPNVLFSLYVGRAACGELGLPLAAFLRYVALRPLVGALAPLGLLLAWKELAPVDSWWELCAAGAAMVAVSSAVWIGFVLRGDPHLDLWGGLRARARRAAERSAR
jgi:O-antigen/teichoic acid export membrane protein